MDWGLRPKVGISTRSLIGESKDAADQRWVWSMMDDFPSGSSDGDSSTTRPAVA